MATLGKGREGSRVPDWGLLHDRFVTPRCHSPGVPEAIVTDLLPLLAINLGAVTLVMILVWFWSLRLRDVSIVDIAWGADGALIALITFALAPGALPRKLLLTGMAAFWGIRLALYIGLR